MFWKKITTAVAPLEPRPHHYEFAHKALRAFCEHSRSMMLEVKTSGRQREFIGSMSKLVCDRCVEAAATDLSPDDIRTEVTQFGKFPTILVTMPLGDTTTAKSYLGRIQGEPVDPRYKQLREALWRSDLR